MTIIITWSETIKRMILCGLMMVAVAIAAFPKVQAADAEQSPAGDTLTAAPEE